MNQNARSLSDRPIDHAVQGLRKRPVRSIGGPALPAPRVGPAAYLRNTAVGVALAYVRRLDSLFHPVAFCAAHAGILGAAVLHLVAPLAIAWFASHWSDRMEATVWTGSPAAQLATFVLLWMVSLLGWSLAWLAARAVAGRVRKELRAFAETGENYYASSQNRPAAKDDRV